MKGDDKAVENVVPLLDPDIPWLKLASMVVATRVFMASIAWLSLKILHPLPGFEVPSNLLQAVTRWDALWYESVAHLGYYDWDATKQTNVVFLPLFPELVRVFSLNGALNIRVVGIVLNNVVLVVTVGLMWRLAWRETNDSGVAWRAAWAVLLGPVSFFLSIFYSESLFLCCAVACIGAAREKKWLLAGCFGFGAALTRSAGWLLWIPLAWAWLRPTRRSPWIRPSGGAWSLACCGLPLAGFLTFAGFTWVKYGEPLAYFKNESLWLRRFRWPWDTIGTIFSPGMADFYRYWWGLAIIAAVFLIIASILLKLPSIYWVVALCLTTLYLSSNRLEGLPRYLSVVPTFYLTAAILLRRKPEMEPLAWAASGGALVLSVVLFVNGYWFT